MHDSRIGMAARAKLNDPSPIFLAMLLRPFLHEIVTEISRGIAPVTTGTRYATPKMNVLNDFLQIHVRNRRCRGRCDCEKRIGRLIC